MRALWLGEEAGLAMLTGAHQGRVSHSFVVHTMEHSPVRSFMIPHLRMHNNDQAKNAPSCSCDKGFISIKYHIHRKVLDLVFKECPR